MIGTNGELMQLRAWTANFGVGTGGTPPDVQNDANWNDPVTAVWSPVTEVDATGKLTLLSGVATASGSADVFVGVDSFNVTTQQYQTQLIFEILNQ